MKELAPSKDETRLRNFAEEAMRYAGYAEISDWQKVDAAELDKALKKVLTMLGSVLETPANPCSLPHDHFGPCEHIELLTIALAEWPDPDYEPNEDREIKMRRIRDRIFAYLEKQSGPKTSPEAT